MPLPRYGVVVGTLVSHHIDPPDAEGNWPHYHLLVNAPPSPGQQMPLASYDCAVNLKSRTENRVQWKVVRNSPHVQGLLSLPEGYHELARTPTSGALDGIRHPTFRQRLLCRARRPRSPYYYVHPHWLPPRWPSWAFRRRTLCPRWVTENGLNLVDGMVGYLDAGVTKLAVLGAPYYNPAGNGYPARQGLHDIHMNQGDPAGSPWWDDNGIWQDGGIILQYGDGRTVAIMTKFSSQSLRTDDQGHPV